MTASRWGTPRAVNRRRMIPIVTPARMSACGYVRDFLPCALAGRGAFEPCDELRQTLRRHIAQVDERITELAKSRSLLESILATM